MGQQFEIDWNAPEPTPDPAIYVNSDEALAWLMFDRDNPAFYPLFKKFATEAIRHGNSRLSAWLIVNRIRWETNIIARGEGYKICNNLIAFYSRLWSIDHKQFPNFFQRKAMKVKPADELFEARLAERRKWSE